MQLRFPDEIRPGCYSTWSVHKPLTDALEIVLEKSEPTTSLWGRLQHDNKLFVFHVKDVMLHDTLDDAWMAMDLVWRARSNQNSLVLADDDELNGEILFRHGATDPGKDVVRISFQGISLFIENNIYAVHIENSTETSDPHILEEIKAKWDALNSDPYKADLQKVKARYGCILIDC